MVMVERLTADWSPVDEGKKNIGIGSHYSKNSPYQKM